MDHLTTLLIDAPLGDHDAMDPDGGRTDRPGTPTRRRATSPVMATLRSLVPLIPVLITVVSLAACGADGAPTADLGLSPAGKAGQDLAIEKGCGSCHGINGEGAVAPAFQGLIGRTITLNDDSTVVADEAYVIESIREPNAKRVDGYSLPMPQVNLSDQELASIVTYITELSQPATTEAP